MRYTIPWTVQSLTGIRQDTSHRYIHEKSTDANIHLARSNLSLFQKREMAEAYREFREDEGIIKSCQIMIFPAIL